MILGIPIYFDEACRLLHIDTNQLPDMYIHEAERHIQDYLENRQSKLSFRWIDKGVHVLGIDLPEFHLNNDRRMNIEDSVSRILQARREFYEEVEKFQIDLHNVTIAHMEDEDEHVVLAEPYLLDVEN